MGIDPTTHNPRLDLLDISSILASSLYNSSSHHVNMSRVMMDAHHPQQHNPLVNPEILKFANSLFSQDQDHNHNHNHNQNRNQNFLVNHDSKTHENYTVNHDDNQTGVNQYQTNHHEIQYCLPPFPDEAHFNDTDHNGEHMFASNSNMSVQDCNTASSSFVFDHSYLDHNFNIAYSVMNTPSSNPTLNSSVTTYINSSSCSTEDEMESYCSNLMKFDISDFLDVNDFII